MSSIPAPAPRRTVIPPPAKQGPPKKGSSGEHRAVSRYRDKIESIKEGTFPEIEALNAKLSRALQDAPTAPATAVVVPIKRDER